MLQINPFLDCTLYSRIVVHIGQNNQLSLFEENTIRVEENRELFFEDITQLIDNFKNKLNLTGYFPYIDKNESGKRATEISYAYFIQFILYKSLVDNSYELFEQEFKDRVDNIHRSLKAEVYNSIITNIQGISNLISAKLYKPFNDEQEFINQKLTEVLQKPKTRLEDISLWLDIIVFIKKYDFSNIRNDIFGYIYENYLKHLYEETNKGQYFTDPALVEFMLNEIGYTKGLILKKFKTKKLNELSLIDPSCGSGTFLYCAVDRIIDALYNEDTKERSKLVEDTINNNIYGLDIAEFPLYLAEMNIIMRMLPLIVNENYNNPIDKKIKVFKTNDSIYEFREIRLQANGSQSDDGQLNLFDKDEDLGYSSFIRNEDDLRDMKRTLLPPRKRFDFVVGNPPYIDYNECCKQKVLFTQKIKEKKILMSNIYGVNLNTVPNRNKPYSPKPNLYSFFIALGIGLLKDKCKICYIIPQTILTANDLDVLRYHLAKYTTIEKIITFEGKMFIGRGLKQKNPVATSSLIFIARHARPRPDHQVEIVNFLEYEEPNFEKYLKSKKRNTHFLSQVELLNQIENWKFIARDDSFRTVLNEYRNNGITIDQYRHNQANYDDIILDGNVNINKKDLSTKKQQNSYFIPIIDKNNKKVNKFLYYSGGKIKKAQGSRSISILTSRVYKIIWQYQNPSGFYFVNQSNSFPKFMEYCIASNDKKEILFLFSLLSSFVNDWYLKSLLYNETEKAFLLGLRTLKEFFRIPIITQSNQNIRNEIISQTEKMLNLEEKALSDFVDFNKISIQKFNRVEIKGNELVLTKDKNKVILKVKRNIGLVEKIITEKFSSELLPNSVTLSELKNLPLVDLALEERTKKYIDDLVFALYFNVQLHKIGITYDSDINATCRSNEIYDYIKQ
jgi:hypothetical protein